MPCQLSFTINPYTGAPYSIDGQLITMNATFTPMKTNGLPMGLDAAEKACQFIGFNWQQMITSMPASLKKPNITSAVDPKNLAPDGTLIAPPSFFDPPQGGYKGESPSSFSYPFYFSSSELNKPGVCIPNDTVPVETDNQLRFQDCPGNPVYRQDCPFLNPLSCVSSGPTTSFTTTLVGVLPSGAASAPLFTWTWYSNFGGYVLGIPGAGGAQTKSFGPIDPNSGTGGITITSINGVQLPPPVPANQVTTTASGLAYSRVGQTFNGTVTLINAGSAALNGPLQVLFTGLAAGVTLTNETGNLSGTPYLTVPVTDGLAPGQSVTVSVQFKNPSNATINFTPAIYSGSIG
jgi:hypothetical protein